jgi:hypothetical protein
MLSITLNSQQPTVRFRLSKLSDAILELQNLAFNYGCDTQYDITEQIPDWVLQEKKERLENNQSTLTIFDFVQKYYDWLYCDSPTGAQYQLSQDFLDLIDIDETKSQFLQKLAISFADGFVTSSLEQNGGLVKEENLREFLKNIRTSLYHKKTTEDGIRYFFTRLYGIDEESVNVEVPKKHILRLNGGRFYDESFKFPSGTGGYEEIGTLSGSYLNGSRLQDSNWIQDWSYLLKVGILFSKYKENYLNIMHPAGIKVVFEKTLADYQGPTYDETVPVVCEYPLLRNYSAYGISFDYSGRTAGIYVQGWSPRPAGITFVGLTATIACATGYTGFSGPTHLFPSWTEQTNVFNFKGININTMLQLCYPVDLGSPNSGSVCP